MSLAELTDTAAISRYIEDFGARLMPLRKRRFDGDRLAKVPIPKGWTSDGYETDVDDLREKLSQGHGIGWILGEEDLVIDVDAPTKDRPEKVGRESLVKLEKLLGVTLAVTTTEICSPTGGRHYYLRKPKGVKFQKTHPDYPDIEFLKKGNYVCIAGTPHWQGGEYKFGDFTEMLDEYGRVECPQVLRELLEYDPATAVPSSGESDLTPDDLRDLLHCLNVLDYGKGNRSHWLRILFAFKSAGGRFEDFLDWCLGDSNYTDEERIRTEWGSTKRDGITVATLVKAAGEADEERKNEIMNAVFSRNLASFDAAEEFENLNEKTEADSGKIELEDVPNVGQLQGRSDNANATRFVNRYGEDLRYVPAWKSWLCWSGNHWKLDKADSRTSDLAKRYAKSLWDLKTVAPTADDPKAVASFVTKSNSAASIAAVKKLASSDQRIVVDYSELDSEPYLFNCANGTLDLRTGQLREHRRGDLLTQMSGVKFDADADCPNWRSAIDLFFKGEEKKGLIEYVQTLIGYCLSGTRELTIFPICWGEGENGKSTFWNTLMTVFGDYATIGADTLVINAGRQHPTEVADLFGKRFVALPEPEEGAALKESRVKDLTGDAVVKARRLHENFWDFTPSHTFWLSTNHKPKIVGKDDGIWRRVKLIPFTVCIKDFAKVDPNFSTKLEAELPGILNWCLEGWQRFRREGLEEPPVVTDQTNEYRSSGTDFDRFVAERLAEDENGELRTEQAFDSYQEWSDFGCLTKTQFKSLMAGKYQKVKATRGPNRNSQVYRGVRLRQPTG